MSRIVSRAALCFLAFCVPVRADDLRVPGVVEPIEVIDIGAQVSGRIVNFGADPADKAKTITFGSEVKAGTVLAMIDSALFDARLEAARANLARAEAELTVAQAKLRLAERDLDRLQELARKGAVSAAELDQARGTAEVARGMLGVGQAAIAQRKAALKEAAINVEHCVIRAPVDGVVIDRRVNIGQTVVASLKAPSLFLMATDLKKLQARASVEEGDIGRVRVGQQVRIGFGPRSKKALTGKVSQIRLNAVRAGGVATYTVMIDIENTERLLMPFQTVDITIVTGGAEKKER